MKVSDLMLDLATGDASIHDAYIQEAAGKVKVSCAYFDAAEKIAGCADSADSVFIQEAADAGLPTDADGACTMACEAVKQAAAGLYDLIITTAKKIKESATKDMKLALAIGKRYGVTPNQTNFADCFATPVATAVSRADLECDNARFMKARYSAKIASAYTKGITAMLMAFGLNITDVFKDPVIAGEVEKNFAGKDGAPASFKGVESYLSDGGKLIKVEKMSAKDSHYTDKPAKNDVYELLVSLYVVIAVSEAVIKATSSKAGKNAVMARFNDLCDKEDCTDKKVSKAIDAIGTDCKTWADSVETICASITKGYTDSIYVLSTAVNGSSEK